MPNALLSPDVARAALVFLDRCQIQGSEASAFLRVHAALMAEANRPEAEAPPPAPERPFKKV
jgi:hypothetical protein